MWSLYNGFGVSIAGIIPYRGVYFGMYDSISGINPFRHDKGALGLASKFAIAQVLTRSARYKKIVYLSTNGADVGLSEKFRHV